MDQQTDVMLLFTFILILYLMRFLFIIGTLRILLQTPTSLVQHPSNIRPPAAAETAVTPAADVRQQLNNCVLWRLNGASHG